VVNAVRLAGDARNTATDLIMEFDPLLPRANGEFPGSFPASSPISYIAASP
jgi:hypothetical protein